MAAVATLTNQLQAYLTSVAGASDAQRDSRVLGAGTTGTLVAAATGATVQAGSAIVAAAAELPSFPQLERAFGDGRVSSQHVSVILQTTKGLGNREDVVNTAVGLAAATDPRGSGVTTLTAWFMNLRRSTSRGCPRRWSPSNLRTSSLPWTR